MTREHDTRWAASNSPGKILLVVALISTTQLASAATTAAAAAAAAAAASTPKASMPARALATSSDNPCPILLAACNTDEGCEECVASVEAAVEACAAGSSITAASTSGGAMTAADTCDGTAALCCGLEADGGACLANTWFKDYIECVALAEECATVVDDCGIEASGDSSTSEASGDSSASGATGDSTTSGASGDLIGNSWGAAAYLCRSAAAAGLLSMAYIFVV